MAVANLPPACATATYRALTELCMPSGRPLETARLSFSASVLGCRAGTRRRRHKHSISIETGVRTGQYAPRCLEAHLYGEEQSLFSAQSTT